MLCNWKAHTNTVLDIGIDEIFWMMMENYPSLIDIPDYLKTLPVSAERQWLDYAVLSCENFECRNQTER